MILFESPAILREDLTLPISSSSKIPPLSWTTDVKLVNEIEEIRKGQYQSEELLITNDLNWTEYRDLLQFIESSADETLRLYFNNELRKAFVQEKEYQQLTLGRLSDTIIHIPQGSSLFECLYSCMTLWLQRLEQSY